MGDKARVAIVISGEGSNMAALIYAARAERCPYEVVLVTGDKPEAPGLALAEAEGVPVQRLSFDQATFFQRLDRVLRDAGAEVGVWSIASV